MVMMAKMDPTFSLRAMISMVEKKMVRLTMLSGTGARMVKARMGSESGGGRQAIIKATSMCMAAMRLELLHQIILMTRCAIAIERHGDAVYGLARALGDYFGVMECGM
jgi:hypothetical protein